MYRPVTGIGESVRREGTKNPLPEGMLESGFVATGRGGGPPGLYQHMREVLVPRRVAFGSRLAFHTLRADGACKDDGRTPSKVDSEQAGNVGSSPAAPTNRGFV